MAALGDLKLSAIQASNAPIQTHKIGSAIIFNPLDKSCGPGRPIAELSAMTGKQKMGTSRNCGRPKSLSGLNKRIAEVINLHQMNSLDEAVPPKRKYGSMASIPKKNAAMYPSHERADIVGLHSV
jgi:hypothetical protein